MIAVLADEVAVSGIPIVAFVTCINIATFTAAVAGVADSAAIGIAGIYC